MQFFVGDCCKNAKKKFATSLYFKNNFIKDMQSNVFAAYLR